MADNTQLSNNNTARNLFRQGLECEICNSFLKEPRLLPCGHAFCLNCLNALPEEDRKCPVDEKSFDPCDMMENGLVNKIMSEMKEESLLDVTCEECEEVQGEVWCEECGSYFCHSCREKTHVSRKMNRHNMLSLEEGRRSEKLGICEIHQREEQLYCTYCGCSICTFCLRDKHSGHKAISIFLRGQERRSHLLDLLNNRSRQMNGFKKFKGELESTILEREAKIEQLKEKISKIEEKITEERETLESCKQSSSLIASSTNFLGNVVKGIPLTTANEEETKMLEDNLSTSLDFLNGLLPDEVVVTISAWGAGGGGSSNGGFRRYVGGQGDYRSASFLLSPCDELAIVVGRGGTRGGIAAETYTGKKGTGGGGTGGGRSFVFSKMRGKSILCAAGGGGGNHWPNKTEISVAGGGGGHDGKDGDFCKTGGQGKKGVSLVVGYVVGSLREGTSPTAGGSVGYDGMDGCVVLSYGGKEFKFGKVGKHVISLAQQFHLSLTPRK